MYYERFFKAFDNSDTLSEYSGVKLSGNLHIKITALRTSKTE